MSQFDYQQLLSDIGRKSFFDWQNLGQERALALFHKTSSEVPAYKDFLQKNNIVSESIRTIEDFSKVPLVDKENYITQYDLKDLCWQGDLTKGGIISQSSGTTGEPIFWPRFVENDKETALLHEFFFKELYQVGKKKTLFIVAFHLGAHIAGVITANAIKDVISGGIGGTLVTAGLNKKNILSTIQKLSSNYDQTILIGYPPFLKDVVMEGAVIGIDWQKVNLKFMYSAESFPENWRDQLHKLSGIKENESGGYNVYGSADLGFMGHETPFTILLRKMFDKGKVDKSMIGLHGDQTPAIYQFHPWNKYFESVDSELVCTSDSGIPLVRYNTKDLGQVFSPDIFSEVKEEKWNLPLITVVGRSNYTATLYGVNIYPEHLREIFTYDDVSEYFNGKFFIKTVYEGIEQLLEIHAQLSPSHDISKVNLSEHINLINKYLRNLNSEYKKLHDVVGDKALPRLILHADDSEEFNNLKSKFKYIVKDNNKNMEDIINSILSKAVYAPSGENSQPWRFEVEDNKISLYNIPDRDNPVYNYNQRGSYFAHGALLENIDILAQDQGLRAEIQLFPDQNMANLVATITLLSGEEKGHELANFIIKRSTNRRKFSSNKLSDSEIQSLRTVADSLKDKVKVVFISNDEKKKKLGWVFSKNEKIMLENKAIHSAVFDKICWTEEEEREKKTGLYLKTMELAPPVEVVFKLLRHWKVADFFRKIKFTDFIAMQNSQLYSSGSLFLSFVIKNEDENYIWAGRLAQRMWLKLLYLGLSAHPLAALPYLYDRVNNGEVQDFSHEQVEIIQTAFAKMREVCNIADEEMIAMTLRVGKDDRPVTTSSRLEPEIIFKN